MDCDPVGVAVGSRSTSCWVGDQRRGPAERALNATGRTGEATELFKRLLDLRNDVGLLSEEYDVGAGRHVGNTPQAFSLVGLISTARTLSGAHTTTSR